MKSNLPEVWIHNPVNRNNFKSMHAMVDLVKELQCNGLSYSPLVNFRGKLDSVALAENEKQTMQNSLLVIKKQLDSYSLHHNINHLLLRFKIGEKVWQKMPCYISWIHTRISAVGTALPCCRCKLELGDLSEMSFSEYWNNPKIMAFREQTSTINGLATVNANWDCRFCWHAPDNYRINQVFKWIKPFKGIYNLGK